MRYRTICVAISLAATAVDSLAGFRDKGQVLVGELAEYERGEIDADALLAQYRRYGLPLPPADARLVKFEREVWEIEGPMRLSHIGFLLPPLEDGGDEQPVRFLVGADVYRGIDSGIRVIDRRLEDGTVVKAKQFDVSEHVVDWEGEGLEWVEFIYHGQERGELDSNALLVTALQMHHLRDPRAESLLRKSLQFEEDHCGLWVSEYRQPAGWSAAEILAETAWRNTINRWDRSVVDPATTCAVLARIVPDLPASRRAVAELIVAEFDPDLAREAKGNSLASAVIAFGLSGENWEALVERVKQEESAFEVLLDLIEDGRVLPYLEIRSREPWARKMQPKLRSWPVVGGFRRVGDYAAVLLDTLCDDTLLGADSRSDPNPAAAMAARARLWRKMAASEDPASFLRERWFQPEEKGGPPTLNRPAIELQILADFERFRAEFPAAFAKARPPRDADSEFLTSAIWNGENYEWWESLSYAERKEIQKKMPKGRSVRARSFRLFDELYRKCPEASDWAVVFLREAVRGYYSGHFFGDKKAREEALELITSVRQPPPGQPYAQRASATLAGLAYGSLYQDDMRSAVLGLIKDAPPGLAIEILYHATGEESAPRYRRSGEILLCWPFLDDHRSRDIAAEPDRFRGASLPEFKELRVADFAAIRIGRVLNLPWQPQPSWGRAEWDLFHERVRKAAHRLDQIIIHGIFDHEEESRTLRFIKRFFRSQ